MRIKHLFWKIFGAFWLASLSIMFATSYVILSTVETEKYRNLYEKSLRDMTERAINHYEQRAAPDSPMRKHFLRRFSGGPRGNINQRQIVRIYRGEELVFQQEDARGGDTFRFFFLPAASGVGRPMILTGTGSLEASNHCPVRISRSMRLMVLTLLT